MQSTLEAIWIAVGGMLVIVIPWVGKLVVAWLQHKIEEIEAHTAVRAIEQTMQASTSSEKKLAAIELAGPNVSGMAIEAAVNKMKGGGMNECSNPTEAD